MPEQVYILESRQSLIANEDEFRAHVKKVTEDLIMLAKNPDIKGESIVIEFNINDAIIYEGKPQGIVIDGTEDCMGCQ